MTDARACYAPAPRGKIVVITLETVLTRDADVIYAALGDDGVMLNVDTGKYHSVNDVGARIWDLLETQQTIGQLCDHLLDEFDVEGPACQAAVLDFVVKLVERGLIHAAP